MQAPTTTLDLTKWVHTPTINVEFRQDYGVHLFKSSCGGCPQFKLMPKYLKNGYDEDDIVQFYLTYSDGRMLPNWEETLLTPRGQVTAKLDQKLPEWSPDKEALYAKILDPLATQLYADKTDILRLEATIPLFLDHSPTSRRKLTIDRVRMVYLENAVEGKNPNYVLVVLSYLDGYKVMQNGVGGGPPAP